MSLKLRIIPLVREVLKLLRDLQDQAPPCRAHQLEWVNFDDLRIQSPKLSLL